MSRTMAAPNSPTAPSAHTGAVSIATDWHDAALDAYFERVLANHGAAGREGLAHEIADHPDPPLDQEVFDQRLFAFARRTGVIDGVELARLALDWLPDSASALRSAGRKVMRRLYVATAFESDAQGYAGRAARHLLAGAWLDPSILLQRSSLGVLGRAIVGNNTRQNRALRTELAQVFRLFADHGVRACVVGSLASSLHARRFVKRHRDIDLVLPTDDEILRATGLLTGELHYRVTTAYDWIVPNGELARFRELDSPGGMKIDLAYLPHWPVLKEHVIVVEGVRVHAVDLRELRNTYAVFLIANENDENTDASKRQGDKSAILALDHLLSLPPTLGIAPGTCDRWPPR